MKTVNNYTETDLGNVSPNPRGEYDNSEAYEYLDLVSLGGGSYLCLAELGQKITGIAPEPGETTEYWQCVAVPGNLTEEYKNIYSDVKRLARETKEDAEKSETAKTGAEAAQGLAVDAANASANSAQESENSKDSAEGYMQRAETAAQTAESAKGTVENLVNGFDEHVVSKTAQAEQAITTAKDNAVSAVTRQEKASVQEVKDQTASYITEQKNLAKQEIDDKIQTFDVDVNAIKKEVSNEGAKQVKAVQDAQAKATEAVETAKTNAVQTVENEGTTQVGKVTEEGTKQLEILQAETAQFTEDREQIQTNKTDIADLRQTKAGAIVESANGETIVVRDSSGLQLQGLKFFGKSEQGENPSVDNPQEITNIGNGGSVDVKVRGKNLLNIKQYELLSSNNTLKVTINDNNDIIYTGSDSYSGSGMLFKGVEPGTYTISVEGDIGIASSKKLNDKFSENTYWNAKGLPYMLAKVDGVCTVTSNAKFDLVIVFKQTSGTIKKLQLELGNKATEYEKFKGEQALTITTPNGLPGLKTQSGGNYTDSTGQQWIADEIDLGRGKRIQRIKERTFDGSESGWSLQSINDYGIANFHISISEFGYSTNIIGYNSHFLYQKTGIADTKTEGYHIATNVLYIRINSERCSNVEKFKEFLKENNVEFLYILKTPIETDLTQEEIEAYRALHTYYPNTTVTNDAGAHMDVSYVADTKKWTENKLTEIVTAHTQGIANLLSLMPLSVQAGMVETDVSNILENVEEMKHE